MSTPGERDGRGGELRLNCCRGKVSGCGPLIPYKDDNPTSGPPYVTISIIVLNFIVFIYELAYPGGLEKFSLNYGAIPFSLLSMNSVQPVSPIASILLNSGDALLNSDNDFRGPE